MSLAEITVTGTYKSADGVLLKGKTIKFTPLSVFGDGGVIVPKTTIKVVTDATDATFTVDLLTSDLAGAYVRYQVQFHNQDKKKFDLTDDSASTTLEDLINAYDGAQPASAAVSIADHEARIDTLEDPTLLYEVFEDFANIANVHIKYNRQAAAGGGSGQVWINSTTPETQAPNAWGVINANHGTGTTSRLNLVGQSPQLHYLRLGKGVAYEQSIRFQFATLSSAGNRYIAFDGFFDGDSVDPNFLYGIGLRYTDNENSGKWLAYIQTALGVETTVDTLVAPVVDTWYILKVTINALATEAKFYIDGVLVATIGGSIVSGDSSPYTAESCTDRSTGSSNFVSRRVDYIRLKATTTIASRL